MSVKTDVNGKYENEAIVGFDSYEEAEQYEKENEGFEVVLLYKRDGDRDWTNKGYTLNGIKVDVNDFDVDCHALTDDDIDGFYTENVLPVLEGFDNIEEAESFITNMKKVYEELQKIDESQIVIMCRGEYYDTMYKEVTDYSYDVHHYMVGVAKKRY
jgi:hypothetical protein